MITKTCEVCGKEYTVRPYLKDTSKYCSRVCLGKSRTGNRNSFYGRKHSHESKEKNRLAHIGKYDGENNPFYGRRHSEETKSKTGIAGLKQDPDRFVKFCTSQSLARMGENNPNYIDGSSLEKLSIRYCEKFNEPFRRRVRAFFGNRCIVCGITERENGRKMAVHHVTYNKKTCCDDGPRLFAPLCVLHHGQSNKDRQHWKERLTEIIMLQYGGKCYYTEEEYTNLLKKG